MLSLLLDEQISPRVAEQLRLQRPEISIESVHTWRAGALMGKEDRLLLAEAAGEQKTLVTYDLRTIPPLLAELYVSGASHGGVVFVDEKTIAPADYGGLIRALVALWEARSQEEWTDRVLFL